MRLHRAALIRGVAEKKSVLSSKFPKITLSAKMEAKQRSPSSPVYTPPSQRHITKQSVQLKEAIPSSASLFNADENGFLVAREEAILARAKGGAEMNNNY